MERKVLNFMRILYECSVFMIYYHKLLMWISPKFSRFKKEREKRSLLTWMCLSKTLSRLSYFKLLYTILFTNMAKAKNCTGLLLLPLNLCDMRSVSLNRLLHPQAMLSVCFLAWGFSIWILIIMSTVINFHFFSYKTHCQNWPKVKAREAR